jgi:hypothetical protein
LSDLRAFIVGGSGYNVAVADPRDEFPNHFVGDLVPTERGWVVVPPTRCPDGHGYTDGGWSVSSVWCTCNGLARMPTPNAKARFRAN